MDICYAHRGMHCVSIPGNLFPSKKACSRVAKLWYQIDVEPSASEASVHLLVVQPSKRGSFCRDDRKTSYRLGDVTMMLLDRHDTVVAVAMEARRRVTQSRQVPHDSMIPSGGAPQVPAPTKPTIPIQIADFPG